MPNPDRIGVLNLIDSLQPGGAERVAVNLANHLPRGQFRSYLCASRGGGALEKELDPAVGYLQLNRRGRYDLRAFFRLTAYIRRNKIQILHAHSSSLFLGRLAASVGGCKFVWHDHLGAGTLGRAEFLYKLFLSRIDAVFTVTHPLAEWTHAKLGVPEPRIVVLPNFVVPVSSSSEKAELPGERGYRVVCVANLRSPKDQIGLIKSFCLVVEQEKKAHLILVGAAVEADYVESVLAEISNLGLGQNVTWLGGREDVPSILADCTIGVLPSVSEGFPLTLLEYGQAGLPAVATRVGGCPEILDQGKAGILVAPGDYPEFASQLLSLLQDPALRQRYAETLQNRVREKYSLAGVVEKVITIYQRILTDHPI